MKTTTRRRVYNFEKEMCFHHLSVMIRARYLLRSLILTVFLPLVNKRRSHYVYTTFYVAFSFAILLLNFLGYVRVLWNLGMTSL
jgi:hypothetical protein